MSSNENGYNILAFETPVLFQSERNGKRANDSSQKTYRETGWIMLYGVTQYYCRFKTSDPGAGTAFCASKSCGNVQCTEPPVKFRAHPITKEFIRWESFAWYGHPHGPNFTRHVRKFESAENLVAIANFKIAVKNRIMAGVSALDAVELEYCQGGILSAEQLALWGGHDFAYKWAHGFYRNQLENFKDPIDASADDAAWDSFRAEMCDASNEDLCKCIRKASEVDDPSHWPKIIDSSRGDVECDFMIFMSEEAVGWMSLCEAIGVDNNQSVPKFVKTGRGIHIIGLYKGFKWIYLGMVLEQKKTEELHKRVAMVLKKRLVQEAGVEHYLNEDMEIEFQDEIFKTILADPELGLWRPFKKVLEIEDVFICDFHMAENISKKRTDLGLTQLYSDDVDYRIWESDLWACQCLSWELILWKLEELKIEAEQTWTGDDLVKILCLLDYYQREYTGFRNEDIGGDFARGKLADVQAMSFYKDPSSRSNGAIEVRNRMMNRVTKRTFGKGSQIDGKIFLDSQKALEYIAKSDVAKIEMDIAKGETRRLTKSTRRMMDVKNKYFPLTRQNADAYLVEMKNLMGRR